MARPREIDIDVATRQAMELFWRKGFVATSMSDIYAATGLKPGNLYATFGDKDGLFRAAFAAYAKHFQATLPLDVEGVGAIRAWLETQVQLATGDPDRKGCFIINTNLEREAHSLETQQLAASRLNDICAFFERQVQVAAARGELSNDPQVVDFLVGTVLAIMTMARSGLPPDAVRRMADQAMATVL